MFIVILPLILVDAAIPFKFLVSVIMMSLNLLHIPFNRNNSDIICTIKKTIPLSREGYLRFLFDAHDASEVY